MLSVRCPQRNTVSGGGARSLLLAAAFAPPVRARTAWETWRAAAAPRLADVGPSERGLLPLLSPRAEELTEREDDRAGLRDAFRESWTRSLGLVSAAAPAISALDAAAIPVLLLKGSALAFGAYASPGLRAMRDVDLLVPARSAGEARRLLEAAGWVPAERHAEGFLDSIHGLAFRGPEGLEVDLHWHALLERPTEDVDALLFDGAFPLALPGTAALAPSPEAHLLLVAVHAQRWSAVPHFVGFADVVVLLRRCRPERLDALADAACGLGLAVPLARTLAAVEAALPGTVPARLAERLDREPVPFRARVEAFLRRRPPGLVPGIALHWFAHARASEGSTAAERLASFPDRMRRVWGLGPRESVAAEAFRRAALRTTAGRGQP